MNPRRSSRHVAKIYADTTTKTIASSSDNPKRCRDAHPLSTNHPKKHPKTTAAPTHGASSLMEQNLLNKGYQMVIGIDEAGRGPLAGPVVAAACCLPPSIEIEGILDDSKTLNAQQREALFSQITTNPDIKWAFCIIDVETIDKINILQSTMLAMEGAVDALFMKNDADIKNIIATTTTDKNNATFTVPTLNSYLLVDGNRLPCKFDKEHSLAVVKGDSKCRCIAAASIIAKVTRDRLMEKLHDQHPQYGFSQHKGYGVASHVDAIRKHGPCVAHRRTFAPVKNWYPLEKKEEKESGGGRKKK